MVKRNFNENCKPSCIVQIIGGSYITVDTPSIVGFCHNKEHKGILTVSIMNEHDCMNKECHYFEKYETYPFWKKYYQTQKLKQLHKEKVKRKKENEKKHIDNLIRKEKLLIDFAYNKATKLGLNNFKIISVHKTENGYTIFYISDAPVNDWYDFREIAFAMNQSFKQKFTLKHAKDINGNFATISTPKKSTEL